jgi:predicted ATPase
VKYRKLLIKNFKGIREVEIDLSNNRILTLVGLNESGKTTILEAISLFYSLAKDKELNPVELNLIRPKGIDFTGKIVLSATLEFEKSDFNKIDNFLKSNSINTKILYPANFSYDYTYNYEVHTYKSKQGLVHFNAKASGKSKNLFETNRDLWNKIIVFIRKELVPEILYYEDFIFEIPDKIEFTINNTPAIKNPVAVEEWKLVFDDILKAVNPRFNSFEDQIVRIWKSDNDTARQRLSAMEKILDQKITKSWKDLFDEKVEKESQRLNFKEIKLIPISEENNSLSFSFKIKTDSGKEFSLNERSKGCKWFFSFLIFTEFRKNRTDNILFLLDEPASNLHSSAQTKILDAIEALSDRSVIVYSTHSHHLINPKWLNGAYIIVNEAMSTSNLAGAFTDNDAKITAYKYFNYVSQSKQKTQSLYFQPILDRLDYRPSLMEPTPSIIITEGKFDWYTFKYINEIIFESKHKLFFYPGKGADSNEDIIRLYMSWGSKFLLLLDSDKKGKTAQTQYLNILGDYVKSRIFTYEDILGKKITTEDIFSERDKEIICNAAFEKSTFDLIKGDPKKQKSTFNFAISQLLTLKHKVELEQETIETFKLLFISLAKNLNNITSS